MDSDLFVTRPHSEKDLEPQEILLDSLSMRHEVEMGRFEVPISHFILRAVMAIFVICFIVLSIRAVQLQIAGFGKYKGLSDRNQFTFKQAQASRGVMYDRNGKQLIYNTSKFDLVCEKQFFRDDYLKLIAPHLGKEPEDLKKEIKERDNALIIAKNMNQAQVVAMHLRLTELPGCRINNDVTRKYEDGLYMSHLIGYRREDGKGDGLEWQYNSTLDPKEAKIRIERNAKNEAVSQTIDAYPEPGCSLVLGIDADLQKKIVDELKPALEASGAVSAAAVALDPRTGEVLALVSLPGYDNNIFTLGVKNDEWEKLQQNKHSPFMNRAISGQYPSGSTIKPFVALAALENNIIKENTSIYCPLDICIANKYSGGQQCFVDWKFHGSSNVKRAIAESVNPFFYIVSGGYQNIKGMGAQKFIDYLEKFNFGQTTGIDLPGEQEGILPSPQWKEEKLKSRWSLGDTYNMSIGQGYLQVTPLQMAAGVGAIANGGTYYRPHVVTKIVDEEKKVIQEIKPEAIKSDIAPSDYLRIVREGMRQTVVSPAGTAHLLDYLPTSSAAKTGTAQVPRPNHYDTWIEIFAPYDNPEIVLVIVAEEVPTKRFFILQTSYDILRWYFSPKKNAPEAPSSSAPILATSSNDLNSTSAQRQILFEEVNELIQQRQQTSSLPQATTSLR